MGNSFNVLFENDGRFVGLFRSSPNSRQARCNEQRATRSFVAPNCILNTLFQLTSSTNINLVIYRVTNETDGLVYGEIITIQRLH